MPDTKLASTVRPFLFLLTAPGVLACGPDDAQGSARAMEPPATETAAIRRGPAPGSPLPPALDEPTEARFAAWTAGGELVLAGARTGRVFASAPARAGMVAQDVAYDARHGRVVVVEESADDESGEITTRAIGWWGELRAPAHVAWIDGFARVLPAPHGIVVFEESYGERWKVLWDDSAPGASVPMDLPRSVRVNPSVDADAITLDALTWGVLGGGLARASAHVLEHAMTAAIVAPIEGGRGRTARLAATDRGDVLVEATSGKVVVTRLEGASRGLEVQLDAGAGVTRIEHAVAVAEGRVLAVLTSNEDRLVAAAFDRAGRVASQASIALPGSVRVEERFFSREMRCVAPDRLLVATDAGVVAIDVVWSGGEVHLTIDPAFDGADLRGPLDGPIGGEAPPGSASL